MNRFMNNTNGIIVPGDQCYPSSAPLPPIVTFFTRPLENNTHNAVPQECGRYLNDNDSWLDSHIRGNLQINQNGNQILAQIHQEYPTTSPLLSGIGNATPYPSYITIQTQDDYVNLQAVQHHVIASKKIQIKCQPCSEQHPRTEKESKKAAHFIQVEEGVTPKYPTIFLIRDWAKKKSVKNYIEVALVGIDNQPHPYTIKNKKLFLPKYKKSILRSHYHDQNMLYFLLTKKDFSNGYKTFQIEVIKSKQDDTITKELIRERQLYKSKLRFTRVYVDKSGEMKRDEDSVEYSCEMIEKYGDVKVKHISSQYGPISGNQLLIIVFTGLTSQCKKTLSFRISEQKTNWLHEIKEFDLSGNTVCFSMPPFGHPDMNEVKAEVTVFYEEKKIYEPNYIYMKELDGIVTKYDLKSTEVGAISSTGNTSDDHNQDMADSANVMPTSSEKVLKNKSRKRVRNN